MNSVGRILLTVVSITTACAFTADAPLGRGDPIVIDRGPFHRTLRQSVPQVTPDGKVTMRVSDVIELASGMHRRTEGGVEVEGVGPKHSNCGSSLFCCTNLVHTVHKIRFIGTCVPRPKRLRPLPKRRTPQTNLTNEAADAIETNRAFVGGASIRGFSNALEPLRTRTDGYGRLRTPFALILRSLRPPASAVLSPECRSRNLTKNGTIWYEFKILQQLDGSTSTSSTKPFRTTVPKSIPPSRRC